jgi:hypothetical protein
MPKETKKAEMAMTDAGKFPIESCRAKLASHYGEDTVALSGPCAGSKLADCVCQQLDRRWDSIKKRFAGKDAKVSKLAKKLADSFMRGNDGTEACVGDLVKMKFDKTAAAGIAEYLKAYAIDSATDEEVNGLMDEVDADDDDAGFPGDDGDSAPPFGDEDAHGDAAPAPADEAPDEGGEPPMPDDMPDAGGMPDAGMDIGGEETITLELPASVAHELHELIENQLGEKGHGDIAPGSDVEIEVIDDVPAVEDGGAEPPVMDEVPGEPAGAQEPGEQIVVSDGPPKPAMGEMQMGACAATEKASKEAALHEARTMKAGKLQRIGQTILKLGPEMSINNTDQQAGHDGKKLGNAKEKAVEAPKCLEEGNVKPEGYTAGDNKFSDGSTLGKEEKFKAKTVGKDEVSGGKSSLMGKDESFPEGGPSIPAGSAPIGGETWEGGDVSTKGTVIATFRPDGLLVEAGGKKYLAAVAIKSVSRELAEAVGRIKFDGDGKKFAKEALGLIKAASHEDGITKTETSKLEAEKFTNDGDKKPAEGGAMTGKGKGSGDYQNDGVTKINTSKLESEKFTNDGDKKPMDKACATGKQKKVAADKELPKPKAVGDNMEPEGYTGGKKEVQDGSTMGNEEKFSPEKVADGSAQGSAFTGDSTIGKDESKEFEKAKVPAGGPPMGGESNTGGTLSNYKGTASASAGQSQKREHDLEEMEKRIRAEAEVREARLVAASVYVADLLRHGDISPEQYAQELEKTRAMPVQAIQALARSTTEMRAKQAARYATAAKAAALGVPIVLQTSEKSLKERLVEQFKLTKRFNDLENMK